jgi:arylsulfatase A-like enzyme
LDISQAKGQHSAQGASLMGLLTDPSDWRDWALCEYRDSGHRATPPVHTTMLRHANWKLVIWHGPPATALAMDGELYDMSKDPNELQNLYHDPEYRDLREQLKDQLLNVMDHTEDRTQPRVSNW